MIKLICSLLCFLFLYAPCYAAPVLNFSDIDSGPKTGNSDTLGSGVIVTVWGNRLGSTQGASKVYVGNAEVTQVYYWKNADGTLPSGPAELYSQHKMQEIAFSIPASAVDGDSTIKVEVDGVESNTIPFAVRTGNIFFIKSTGNDSTGDGSWGNPWLTYNAVMSGDGKLTAGDTIYSVGVTSTAGIRIGGTAQVRGTAASPIALIAYPNSRCAISGEGGDESVISNYYPSNRNNGYVHLSKLSVTAYGNSPDDSPNGITANPYNRVVGVEITGPTVYFGYGGAITCTGSASNPPMGGKYLGIYIHDYGYRSTTPGLNNYSYEYSSDSGTWTSPPYDGVGDSCTNCTSMDRFQHLYYLSIRQAATIVDPYEIAWNNLSNNPILEGIHIYDMTFTDSGFNAPLKVHHNYISNQGGPALDTSLPYDSEYKYIEFYNNVITVDGSALWSGEAYRTAGTTNIKIYNNTVYGYRVYGMSGSGTSPNVDYRNNILVDAHGFGFASYTPIAYNNNLFYSTQGTSLPSWYSTGNGDINSNPLLADPTNHDFSLLSNSPCIDEASQQSSLFDTDFVSTDRGAVDWDIGAYEYTTTTAPTVNAGTDQAVSIDSASISGTYTLEGGRTVSSCTWSNDRGGSGTLTAAGGTITGTVTGLSSGVNVITITVTDSEAEEGSDSLNVTYTPVVSTISTNSSTSAGCMIR